MCIIFTDSFGRVGPRILNFFPHSSVLILFLIHLFTNKRNKNLKCVHLFDILVVVYHMLDV